VILSLALDQAVRVTARRRDDDALTRLALAAGRGDTAALADLVRGTQADVWRFCASLHGRDEADDLTQETYARAIRSLPGFTGGSTVRTWLLAIARRTAADSVRRATRRRRLIDRVQTSDGARGTHSVARTGEVDLVYLVDDLADDKRDAFVLTQILGLEYAEAAHVLDCPVGTIRSRVARARRDLIDAALDDERAVGGDE
jgi:RNA polymerase sigma-70 factor (ECF subfamily)